MEQLITILNKRPTPIVSTTTLVEITHTPEWQLAELIEPLILSGKLKFHGQNKFGIDLWLYSQHAEKSLPESSLCLARLKRTSKFVDSFMKGSRTTDLSMHLIGLLKNNGFSLELVRQVMDIIHLLAKGELKESIEAKGYCLNFDDLPDWIHAINDFEVAQSALTSGHKKKTLYKIIDRLGFEPPKTIGMAYVYEAHLQQLIDAVGEYVFEMDDLQDKFTSREQVFDLACCRFELQPASLDEEEIYFSDVAVIDEEPSLLIAYDREIAMYRSNICKVLGIDVAEPAFYEAFEAKSGKPGNIDFGSDERIKRVLDYQVFGRPSEIITVGQKARLRKMLARHGDFEAFPVS